MAQILLLLGREVLRLHKVRYQCNRPLDVPFNHRLNLGWVVIGDVFLGHTHKLAFVMTYKTNGLLNGRPSYLSLCANSIHAKEKLSANQLSFATENHRDTTEFKQTAMVTVFIRTENYERTMPSLENECFCTTCI